MDFLKILEGDKYYAVLSEMTVICNELFTQVLDLRCDLEESKVETQAYKARCERLEGELAQMKREAVNHAD